ncbi:MAG: putative metal-binding motif-containing protein [Myxococcota bacterium]|nr:putative metal-binding motif-containing protein [Myxococcota bacterium]
MTRPPVSAGERTGKAGRGLLAAGSAFPAALIVAVADNLLGGGDLDSFRHVLALILALTFPLVLVEVLVGAMLPREVSLRRSARLFLGLFTGEDGPARLFAGVTEGIVLFFGVQAVAGWFIVRFHHSGLISLSITAVLVVLVLLAIVLFLPLATVWRALLRAAGDPSLYATLPVLSAIVGGFLAWGVQGGILGAGWDIRPPLLLLLLLLLQLGWAFLLAVGNRRLSLLVLAAGLCCASLLLPQTLLSLEEDHAAERVVSRQAGLSVRILLAGRDLLDRDGDGYPALLGGGDCDDTDPRINPGAIDLAGNGLDEDCRGGDNLIP